MSLYNLLFGVNSQADILKKMLGLDQKPLPPGEMHGEYIDYCVDNEIWPTGRFRDIHLSAVGQLKIILYTRNGGGNRREYRWVFSILRRHPCYVRDYDDKLDKTYAYIQFNVPEQYKELAIAMATGEEPKQIGEKFKELIEQLRG